MELSRNFESQTSAIAHQSSIKRFPFEIACLNTDNGFENGGSFSKVLKQNNVFYFYSNAGTPIDNPRVERSHLTDEIEFYGRGNIYAGFNSQKETLSRWEYVYNYIRPHQALGYLTPMAFYKL